MTLNLRKDCEAFYTFDERSFDSQRNFIQDRSGYGRHVEANGGPSIGVNGPDGFEAASFDGSDDEFILSGGFDQTIGSRTIHLRLKIEDTNTQWFYKQSGSDTGEAILYNNGGIRFNLKNSNKDTDIDSSISTGEYYDITLRYDGSVAEGIIDAELRDSDSISSVDQNSDPTSIGSAGGTRWMTGEIALVGRWHRALSDAEIDYLNRLTGPRRANL